MGAENPFQDSDKLEAFINRNIISRLPDTEKEGSRNIVEQILIKYEGQDIDALSVLSFAATVGRFDEFVRKLEEFHKKTLAYVHPEARKVGVHRGIESFFLQCYDSLGIRSTEIS